ncbi:MAG: hypothetical protein QJR02_11495 [Sinobacteraceae bacterium]|nr:hypothetical protein [Nevskiaceae bacterium]
MNTVQLAAAMYQCRDAARTLLGVHYARDMDLWAQTIRLEAERLKCSELAAALRMSRETPDGFRTIVILAAAVEMSEPGTQAT